MLTFDEVKHLYTWNGEPVASVSQIIKTVCGSSYANIDPQVLAKAAWRGQALHSASELVDAGVDHWEYIDQVKTASCLQFNECIDITAPVEAYARLDRPKWDAVEHRFYCGGEFPFCGTIDRLKGIVPNEIKCTASEKKDDWRLQLSFYAIATKSDEIGNVYHVTKDGKGKVITDLEPRFEDAFSILRVFYLVHHKQWLKQAKEQLHG